jgi:hypothetical protein
MPTERLIFKVLPPSAKRCRADVFVKTTLLFFRPRARSSRRHRPPPRRRLLPCSRRRRPPPDATPSPPQAYHPTLRATSPPSPALAAGVLSFSRVTAPSSSRANRGVIKMGIFLRISLSGGGTAEIKSRWWLEEIQSRWCCYWRHDRAPIA